VTHNNERRSFVAGLIGLGLAGCGGGGGGSSSTPSPSSGGGSTPPPSPAIPFANVSVHDPSVIRAGGNYYVFGSHLAAARSADLMNWTRVADGVNAANPLFGNVLQDLQETFAWSQSNDLWAPDVAQLGDGRFYMYYCSCKGDSPRSALGVAVADQIAGPYVNRQILLRSGMWDEISEDGVSVYDAQVHPNVVDPQTFLDQDGHLWMVYGSYSGGIFILSMDPATGLPFPGQGYGRHLLGGHHARIEGPYILHNAQTGYYYLFTSFGGLAADGGYNIRVARADAPDGPYFDAAGTDMSTVKGNPSVLFDDTRIAPHGQKLFGNHQLSLASGESGTPLGYVSPGHNSAYFDADSGRYFLIFHTRFPNRGEQHEVRVHELLFNEDGWPVAAPLRYAPLSLNATALSPEVSATDAQGSYKLVDHGKDISATLRNSQTIRLDANGSVSGAVTGAWLHKGNNFVALTIDGVVFNGVLSRQWNTSANAFAVTFTAQAGSGVSVWGVRTGG
jgi:arabinan endo-1,5-alpha-L-arabinosidase